MILVLSALVVAVPRTVSAAADLYVRPERINVRRGPTTDSPVVGNLTAGTRVSVRVEASGWALVEAHSGGVNGWIRKDLLAAEPPARPRLLI